MIKYGRFISSGWIDETLIIRVSFQHSHGICSSHLKKFHDIDIYNLKIHTSSQKKIKKKKKNRWNLLMDSYLSFILFTFFVREKKCYVYMIEVILVNFKIFYLLMQLLNFISFPIYHSCYEGTLPFTFVFPYLKSEF